MKRDIKELIPLIAIGLMIIGAIIILVAMNSTDETKENNESMVVEGNKIKIPDEDVTPVGPSQDGDIEVSNPVGQPGNDAVLEDITNQETNNQGNDFEILEQDKTEQKTESVSRRDYIESMVNDFMFGTTSSNKTTENKEESTSNTNSITVSNTTNTDTNTNKPNNNTHTIVSKPTTNTTIVNKQTVVTYNNIDKSVNVGNYVVSTTTNNKIISAKSGSKNVALSVLDSGNVSLLKATNYSVYAFEIGGGIKKYTLVGGKLKLLARGYFAIEATDMAITDKYVFIVTTNGILYAFEEKESTFVQAGITREYDEIVGIKSVSGSDKITVETEKNDYTYTFDGVNFVRK